LVILDEASSRLDPATERRIERAVDALLRGNPPASHPGPGGASTASTSETSRGQCGAGESGRTGIVIAHRLTTVQRVDDILILGAGRVLEHGPRATLAADPGSRFNALLRTGELTEVLA
ncbi:MAG TPA: hypothetical protein VH257_02320, partial [Chloroflexota bacterium]|nr:hypothetical protein [Chloroflexota bacterium]